MVWGCIPLMGHFSSKADGQKKSKSPATPRGARLTSTGSLSRCEGRADKLHVNFVFPVAVHRSSRFFPGLSEK